MESLDHFICCSSTLQHFNRALKSKQKSENKKKEKEDAVKGLSPS